MNRSTFLAFVALLLTAAGAWGQAGENLPPPPTLGGGNPGESAARPSAPYVPDRAVDAADGGTATSSAAEIDTED